MLQYNNMTLSGTSTPGQSGHGRDDKVVVLNVPRRSRAGSSPSDCLMSYFSVGMPPTELIEVVSALLLWYLYQ